MASYYLQGYTPPSNITNSSQVKQLQQQLGVKADGIWGPQTQAAYNASNASAQSYIPSDYTALLKEFQSLLAPQTISYSGPSRAELEGSLRPSYDLAIKNRQAQTATNKANIDVDAASRGMGTSTWVTDVKDRQQNEEADDINYLEAAYAKDLMAALQSERQNQLAVDQYNANARAQALQSALGLAGDMYNQRLSMAKSVGGGGSSSKGSSTNNGYASSDTLDSIISLLSQANSKERQSIYSDPASQQYISSIVGNNMYEQLKRQYPDSYRYGPAGARW